MHSVFNIIGKPNHTDEVSMSQVSKKTPAQRPAVAIKKRELGRVDVRPSEGISANIHLAHFTESISVRVYDISIQGICIIVSEDLKEHIHLLQKYQIDLDFAWGVKASGIYTCCWVEPFKDQFRIGFRNYVPTRVEGFHPPEGHSKLLDIPKEFPIIGFFYKDFFYYERSAIKLLHISSKEVHFEIFDTEVLLLPGMNIELLLALQASTAPRIRGKVQQVTPTKEKNVMVSMVADELPYEIENDLINHLLQNTDLTPEEIRAAGFKVKEIANSFRFRYLRTQEEYEEVLDLRFLSYKNAGKVKPDYTPQSLAAPLDHLSRILLAYHGNKLVASVALSFPESEEEILDTQRALPGGYPQKLPKKIEVIEVSRLCTDPDYRRGDLLLRMFEQIYKVFGLSERKYLLSSTDNKLWPIYRQLGFKKTGHSYLHPYLAGIEHHLILIHRNRGTHATSLDPVRWNILYGNMTKYMLKRRSFNYNFFDRMKLALYTWVGRLMKVGRRKKY